MQQAVIDAARALVPVLAAEAGNVDRARRITEPSEAALRGTGLFRLGTPARFGGMAADVRTAVEVCVELARGCAASSWIVGIAYGGNLFAGQLGDAVREELWGDRPDAFVCGTANPSGTVSRTPAGFVLDGSWPWISGIHHAPWTLLGIAWGEGERGLALVPTAKLDTIDVWHVAGMRGTGSNTAVATELAVDHDWVVYLTAMAEGRYRDEHPDEPRVTFHLSINLPLVGTCVGIAAAALESVTGAVARGKRLTSPLYATVAESPAHQVNVAEAAILIDTARLHLAHAADEVDGHARAGRRPDAAARARLRMSASHAVRCAREAVSALLDTAGAGSFADSSVLQRTWRDLETASRHAAFSTQTSSEFYGRVLLGVGLPAGPVL
ncbi:acyl-CoA dehydrogenase family protein [Amycolatopsis rhabdoformis]|uniref:Acyl-CoA dehydrogenase family protein n=1 Tax=Amycolatopsis rhabdoformis TaxID=1448059 RepID=A0ABZ1IGI8_9PSEU|nr:acyl-CoA dehydrogenase family protein [Amycolatopsis rhabdoformis]WSE33586.1 acyl-CoA dehydrogenase family protein [Amycolatopsis rhabdoformis]